MIATSARRRISAVGGIIVALLTVALLSACTSIMSTDKLPTPQSLRDGWTLHIEFDTVVNLPEQSKVMVNGIEAGVVDTIKLSGNTALATLSIDDGIDVAAQASVELRQDTLLGDTYVAITGPASGASGPIAKPGTTIGKENVKPAVQIEDLMASLANFLGSGSLPALGGTFNAINSQFPQDPAELQRIERTLIDTLTAWGDNTQDLNKLLIGLTSVTGQFAENADVLSYALSPEGVKHMRSVTDAVYIPQFVAALHYKLLPIVPIVPLLKSLTGTIDDVVVPMLVPGWPDFHGQQSNASNLVDLLTNKLIPFFKKSPKLNIRRLAIDNGVSNRQLAEQMVRTFRMIGMVR